MNIDQFIKRQNTKVTLLKQCLQTLLWLLIMLCCLALTVQLDQTALAIISLGFLLPVIWSAIRCLQLFRMTRLAPKHEAETDELSAMLFARWLESGDPSPIKSVWRYFKTHLIRKPGFVLIYLLLPGLLALTSYANWPSNTQWTEVTTSAWRQVLFKKAKPEQLIPPTRQVVSETALADLSSKLDQLKQLKMELERILNQADSPQSQAAYAQAVSALKLSADEMRALLAMLKQSAAGTIDQEALDEMATWLIQFQVSLDGMSSSRQSTASAASSSSDTSTPAFPKMNQALNQMSMAMRQLRHFHQLATMDNAAASEDSYLAGGSNLNTENNASPAHQSSTPGAIAQSNQTNVSQSISGSEGNPPPLESSELKGIPESYRSAAIQFMNQARSQAAKQEQDQKQERDEK